MTSLPFSAYIRSPRVAARSEKNSKVEIYKLLSGFKSDRGVLEFAPNSYLALRYLLGPDSANASFKPGFKALELLCGHIAN
jgi:hypothetical protein